MGISIKGNGGGARVTIDGKPVTNNMKLKESYYRVRSDKCGNTNTNLSRHRPVKVGDNLYAFADNYRDVYFCKLDKKNFIMKQQSIENTFSIYSIDSGTNDSCLVSDNYRNLYVLKFNPDLSDGYETTLIAKDFDSNVERASMINNNINNLYVSTYTSNPTIYIVKDGIKTEVMKLKYTTASGYHAFQALSILYPYKDKLYVSLYLYKQDSVSKKTVYNTFLFEVNTKEQTMTEICNIKDLFGLDIDQNHVSNVTYDDSDGYYDTHMNSNLFIFETFANVTDRPQGSLIGYKYIRCTYNLETKEVTKEIADFPYNPYNYEHFKRGNAIGNDRLLITHKHTGGNSQVDGMYLHVIKKCYEVI